MKITILDLHAWALFKDKLPLYHGSWGFGIEGACWKGKGSGCGKGSGEGRVGGGGWGNSRGFARGKGNGYGFGVGEACK